MRNPKSRTHPRCLRESVRSARNTTMPALTLLERDLVPQSTEVPTFRQVLSLYNSDRIVSIKVIRKDLAKQKNLLSIVINEVKIMKKL